MPLYLADTSAWNRGAAAGERWWDLLARAEVATCTPIRLELLFSARGKSDYGALERLLADLPSLPLDEQAARRAERVQELLAAKSQHRGPRPMDLLIAAVAEARDATVLHYDSHFELIARSTQQPAEWLAPPGTLD